MKKLLMIGSIVLVLGLLIAGFTTPIFAHSPGNGDAWEGMHEACENGDWEAMAGAAEEVHGGYFDSMPYHNEDNFASSGHDSMMNGWGGMGGHMGRGMMGG